MESESIISEWFFKIWSSLKGSMHRQIGPYFKIWFQGSKDRQIVPYFEMQKAI